MSYGDVEGSGGGSDDIRRRSMKKLTTIKEKMINAYISFDITVVHIYIYLV